MGFNSVFVREEMIGRRKKVLKALISLGVHRDGK